jgi:hypothetical protein
MGVETAMSGVASHKDTTETGRPAYTVRDEFDGRRMVGD